MNTTAVAGLLTQVMGLDPSSIGLNAIRQAVEKRLRERSEAGQDIDDYVEILRRSPQEMRALLEVIVVSETWFFRDPQAFALLRFKATSGNWLARSREKPLRFISIGCSTGEEPYSMSMALLDGGMPPGSFRIDAMDLSRNNLAVARRSVYGPSSFRGRHLDYRDRHFERLDHRYRLCRDARRWVDFHHGNVLHPPMKLLENRYEAVFCRNLLIYLDAHSRQRAIRHFRHLLKEDGILFCGHAEANLMLNAGFEKIHHPRAFAFEASPTGTKRKKPRRGKTVPRTVTARKTVRRLPPLRHPPQTERTAGAQPAPPVAPPGHLQQARDLADQGRIGEARELCLQHLRAQPRSADAFYLLGVLHAAEGDTTAAAEVLRKAVYLQPDHQDALIQLALLADRRGDRDGARRLRARAARVAGHGNETGHG